METPEIALKLARTIKALRQKKGWTQEGTAERIGMDLRYYQRLESQKPYTIRIDTLERIAHAFHKKPADLLK